MTQAPLSAREQQVLALLAQEKQNNEIAHHLNITVHTVEKHLTHIYRKLGVQSRAGALCWYWSHAGKEKNTGNP